MPKIERKTQKIFGGNAESDQLAVFGTMITGTPVYNDDVETLQSEAYTEGWQVAVAANEAPFMEEMNGVQYGFSKQLAYLFQQGIPEWDAGTTYYLNSFCQVGGVIYKSMQDENINHSPADDSEGTYWIPLETGGGGGLEVCDIGMALYVDETKGLRRRLNGTTVLVNTNTQAFVTKLKSIAALYPSLACTETEWSQIESASDLGQVGKFVIQDAEEIQYYAYSSGSTTYLTTSTEDSDSVNVYNTEFVLQGTGSISSDVLTYESQTYNRASGSDTTQEVEAYVRLPKVINVQGLIDLQNLGVTVAAGLPNIEGQIGSSQTAGILSDQGGTSYRNNSGAFTAGDSWANPNIGTWPGKKLKIDASLSNPIYGNSTTVQPEAVQYPYFIQIATGQETEVNITNEIELNNPFFFGMYQYFDSKPNNLSWLRSAGQWNSKAVYPDYYNWLLGEKNNPETLPADTSNVEIVGSLTDNNGVLSGFSSSNYALTDVVLPSSITSYEFVAKFTTGSDITTKQGILANSKTNRATPQIGLDSTNTFVFDHPVNSTTWATVKGLTPQANTTYWVKAIWDGTTFSGYYKTSEETEYTLLGTDSATTIYWVEQIGIGIDLTRYPFFGSIDLKESYININGSRWWTGMSNGVKYSTEDYNDYDYVINTTDETFRLPLKNGLETAFPDSTIPDGFALYYYVGETVQNANLIDAGRFGELVSTKANIDLSNCTRPYVTETYANGTSWYRVYSDGFCIQGGVNVPAQSTTSLTIQLLKTLKDTVTGVSAQISQYNEISAGTHTSFKVYVQTTSTITIAWAVAGYPSLSWLVTGYLPD